MLLFHAFTETPMGGGDMIRGLNAELQLIEEARLISKVRPRGLWVLPGRRGLGGLFASGELKSWLKEVGD